ncbi:MAG: NAD-dependent malic enzyme [Acidimicrobiales bacterium]|nr:NAD-dependent malic enzyme [Acidimicrobiales bacterium]
MAHTPTAAYSISMKVTLDNVPGVLGRLTLAIGEAGGNICGIGGFEVKTATLTDTVVVQCRDEAHQIEIIDVVESVDGVTLHSWYDRTFHMHEGGKIEVLALMPVGDADDLSMAYTPGVARVCMAIHDEPAVAHTHTIKKNTVAIVSDGTAVLGLGDIGPEAAMPVMEGKALLFKEFGGVDAFPVCLDVETTEQLIEAVVAIAPTFGGINLEDIAAPGAFEVEAELEKRLSIPVFHDDQHGTAVVTLAALRNAAKLVGKDFSELTVVLAGMGAAGVAIGHILLDAGIGDIIGVDSRGALHESRDDLNSAKQHFVEHANRQGRSGSVHDVMPGADVFIGVSAPGLITVEDVQAMASDPIVFAMANPDPEIRPELVRDIVAVMATGRSDFPNQINNVLAFPGIFRGALDAQATTVTENMKIAAADAIAESIPAERLSPTDIIPSVFERDVSLRVAAAVARAAVADGVCRM